MPVSSPRDALIDAFASAVEAEAALGALAKVYRGWPSDKKEASPFALPSVSISVQSETSTRAKRKVYRETELSPTTLEVLYETTRKEMSGTLELWTGSKKQREPLELALDDLLEGGTLAPGGFLELAPPGLVLSLPLLYDVNVRVRLLDKNEADASGASDGYFRVVYSFEVSVPRIARVEYNKATFTQTAEVGVDVDVDV